jgi:peptidoglycan/xylan/chitin deacetylase (PgdA/CDA1 family)
MKLSLIVLTILFNITNANIYEKCVNDKHITITFDDGPHINTPAIVNILNNHNISGAFFINGLNVIRNSQYNLIKEMSNQGHVIGTHGFSHAAMEKLNEFNARRELFDNEFIFRQIFNKRPYFYRPPYFSYDAEIVNLCNDFGYEIITTNLNTDDWMMDTADDIYNSFLDKFSNYSGIIMLQHDYQINGNEALEKIINFVKKENYTFVPLDECIGTVKRFSDDNFYGPFLLNGI